MESLNWQQWLMQGRQYEKAGTGKNGLVSKLSPEIVYNLFSMALESYAMAVLDYHETLPDNHTFSDLMDALGKITDINQLLKEQILELESHQRICAFDDFNIVRVDATVNHQFQDVIKKFGRWAHAECKCAAA